MDHVFALVDCENFYVSCERVFAPGLRQRPVAVLSNNDGCIIARSEELKAAGIPMGAPHFEWEDHLEEIGTAVLSSNYALYGDMSRRAMTELEQEALEVERYSIDEAFLTLPALPEEKLFSLASRIRSRISRRQGLPIRVGIGPTKTLAKVADDKAKTSGGVYVCPTGRALAQVLSQVSVGDIWGIGSAYEEKLQKRGVATAEEFRQCPERWIKHEMSVTGLRTALELRGRSCLPLETVRPTRKTLIRSRSFSRPVTDCSTLMEAVAKHAQRAAEKLRGERLTARGLQVFLTTKQFGPPPHYGNAAAGRLSGHTADTRPFLRAARRLTRSVYRSEVQGCPVRYKKAGVMLYDLCPADAVQGCFFDSREGCDSDLMDAIDQINQGMGYGTIGFAAAGIRGRRPWAMKQDWCSPRYTTQWAELPIAEV